MILKQTKEVWWWKKKVKIIARLLAILLGKLLFAILTIVIGHIPLELITFDIYIVDNRYYKDGEVTGLGAAYIIVAFVMIICQLFVWCFIYDIQDWIVDQYDKIKNEIERIEKEIDEEERNKYYKKKR